VYEPCVSRLATTPSDIQIVCACQRWGNDAVLCFKAYPSNTPLRPAAFISFPLPEDIYPESSEQKTIIISYNYSLCFESPSPTSSGSKNEMTVAGRMCG
jgi:hypothetical protein